MTAPFDCFKCEDDDTFCSCCRLRVLQGQPYVEVWVEGDLKPFCKPCVVDMWKCANSEPETKK